MKHAISFLSPVGMILIEEENGFIVSVDFLEEGQENLPKGISTTEKPILRKTQEQLESYFHGKLTSFDLPLQPKGTPFQIACWNVLMEIPYGRTITYGEEAEKVGGRNYSRAVGMANGKNPIAIIIPCHRVIGSNGNLTGYASGLTIKRQLLELEGIPLKSGQAMKARRGVNPQDVGEDIDVRIIC